MLSTVLVLGGSNVDVKAKMESEYSGSTSHPGFVWRTPGGVACNIARNLHAVECPVRFVTAVGDDVDGRWLLQQLEREGLSSEWVQVLPSHATGTYIAILKRDGELLSAVAAMSIMDAFAPHHIAPNVFGDVSVVSVDTNLSTNVLSHVLKQAEQRKLRTVVDPVSTEKAGKLQNLLGLIHTLTPNLDELSRLANLPVHTLDDVRLASRALLQKGVTCVLTTLGAQGVFIASAKEETHVPAKPVEMVDATGAGDAFTAGLLYGYAHGWSIQETVEYGQDLSRKVLASPSSTLGG